MTHSRSLRRLDGLLRDARVVACGPTDRILILSDLHLGDGGPRDEFVHNETLLNTVLSDHYLPKKYRLVLNGDVEDLYKFSLRPVMQRYAALYQLFEQFNRAGGTFKVAGNHDMDLLDRPGPARRFAVEPALRLRFGTSDIFVLHGHQADVLTPKFNKAIRFACRYVVSPLGVRNGSVAHSEPKKYRTEKRIYDFAKRNKVIAVIGHTHRPLFESLSRIDYLKYQIENLCRAYPTATREQLPELERKAHLYQRELELTLAKRSREGARGSLYDSGRLVPCMFNSGCATGKRGFTALEIADGKISLVFWFDKARTTKYFNFNGYVPEVLGGTSYFRVPLKEDSLAYVFARIKLLA